MDILVFLVCYPRIFDIIVYYLYSISLAETYCPIYNPLDEFTVIIELDFMWTLGIQLHKLDQQSAENDRYYLHGEMLILAQYFLLRK